MAKQLVFQINIPNGVQTDKVNMYTFVQDMYETSERNARRYAERCNADYYKVSVLGDFKPAAGKHLDYQKLKVYDFVEYDRILYLDSDYIIKDTAPNIFDLYKDQFAACQDPSKAINEISSNLGMPADRYFNAGFLYLTKDVLNRTRDSVPHYLEQEYEYQGQGILNKIFFDHDINFVKLSLDEWNPVKRTFGLYGDHYSGKKKEKWGKVSYD